MSAECILNRRNVRETISLRPLAVQNRKDAPRFPSRIRGETFFPPNVRSIAEARFHDGSRAVRAAGGDGRVRSLRARGFERLVVDRSGRRRGTDALRWRRWSPMCPAFEDVRRFSWAESRGRQSGGGSRILGMRFVFAEARNLMPEAS
jgi:hypothetical protein